MRKTAALNYLSIILLLGVYLGIKIFASLNFAYVLFPSWGLVYIFSKRLPAKLALLIPGLSVLSFYSLFFNPVSIPWKASLIIVSTILQLQAWASLYQKNSVAALNEFERKIINCSFIGILIPMYLALSGFTLRYRSYENDKLSLLLYALLALLFLESTSRKPVNKLLTRNSNIIEKCIPIVALLFLMASSLLVAHISTGSFYSFIPQTVRYIKRHNPQFKKREEKRLEKDQKNEIAQREVGYSNETKLNSSFSLKKNFSKVAVSLEVKKGNKLLNSDKIYLRCNQFSKFENKKWHSQKFYRSIQGDYFKSDKTGWINYRKPKKQNQLEYAVTLHHKNLTMIPQIGEPYAFKVPKAKIGNRRAQVKHSGLITLQIKADAPLTTKEIRFPETYIYSNSYKPKTKLEKRIQTLARSITENSPTVEDKIIELQNYLHRYCKYSLKVENSYNMHPLENFLFHEKKGHCVLFATAYCLMLRSIGIPAIVCSGYFGGDFKEDRKEYLFYSGNAHTWVEIPVNYKRDYIIADPTPRVMLPDSPSKNKPDKFETKSFKDYLTETKKIWVNAKLKDIYTILSIISLIPFLLFWKWKLLKSLIPEEKNELPYLRAFYKSFKSKLIKHDHESLREYFTKLVEQSPQARELQDLVDYTYKIKYHNMPRDPLTEKTLLKKIKLAAYHSQK